MTSTTYEKNLPYRITIDQVESYMQQNIDNFVAKESFNGFKDQSKRIHLCKQYFYYAFTCQNPNEFEYCKMSDETIQRIGKLNIIMHLFNSKILSAKQCKELAKNVNLIDDEYNDCIVHNMALKEN